MSANRYLFGLFTAAVLMQAICNGDPVAMPTCQGTCCNGLCCPSPATCLGNACYVLPTSAITQGIQTSVESAICDPMILTATADDEILELYVDGVIYDPGVHSAQPSLWRSSKANGIPAASSVVAIKAKDMYAVAAAMLASINHDYLLTNAAWRCTSTFSINWFNWMMPNFDDSLWDPAIVTSSNPGDPYSPPGVSGISPSAKWIWTKRYNMQLHSYIDSPVYCRGRLPTNVCSVGYGPNCGNLCAQQGKSCCNCEIMNGGPTKVCNCCPSGYKCCGKIYPQMMYFCCPSSAQCKNDGTCVGTMTVVAGVVAGTPTSDCPLPFEPPGSIQI